MRDQTKSNCSAVHDRTEPYCSALHDQTEPFDPFVNTHICNKQIIPKIVLNTNISETNALQKHTQSKSSKVCEIVQTQPYNSFLTYTSPHLNIKISSCLNLLLRSPRRASLWVGSAIAEASNWPVSTPLNASIISRNIWYRVGTVCGSDGPSWSTGAKISLAWAIRCNENIQYVNKIIINGVKTICFYMFVRKIYVTCASTMASTSLPCVCPTSSPCVCPGVKDLLDGFCMIGWNIRRN